MSSEKFLNTVPFFSLNPSSLSTRERKVPQIWAFGGGKGGVGKSFLAASFAISLASYGKHVTAIDLDFGGSNLHTALGVPIPKKRLFDFFSGKHQNLKDCASPTPIASLHLISCAQDPLDFSDLCQQKLYHLMEELRQIESDYIILDLGAGTHKFILDLFLYADLSTIILSPEPTSIENAYRFIKGIYFRNLQWIPKLSPLHPMIEEIFKGTQKNSIQTPKDLWKLVLKKDKILAQILKNSIQTFAPKMIVNQVRTQNDIEIGLSIKEICKKYFGFPLDYLGHIEYDPSHWQALRYKKSFLRSFPNASLSKYIYQLTHLLIYNYKNIKKKPRTYPYDF